MPILTNWFKAVILGIVIALFGVAVLVNLDGYTLEEHFGLDTLFKLRGPLPPPDDVVVIALEKESSKYFDVPNNPAEWPRELHAQLIDKLTAAGARSISLDIFFKKDRDSREDAILADAINNSGRVILFTHTHREIEILQPATDAMPGTSSLNIERLVPPVKVLGDAAVALAPFALPKYPLKVTSFWTYRIPAGDVPNLPAVTLQLFSSDAYKWLQGQLSDGNIANLPGMESLLDDHSLRPAMMQLRTLFNQQPFLPESLTQKLGKDQSLSPETRDQIAALIALYSDSHRHYLNFYGPPWHITTIPYYKVLTTPLEQLNLRGKAVFVGFSERTQPAQLDNFNTVYSQPSGLDISGVEIAATAFANLLNRHTLKPLSPQLLIGLVLLYGFVVALLARLFKPAVAISSGLLLAASHVGMSSYLFNHNIVWLPWVIPVLIQTPTTLFLALGWHYFETQRDRKRIRHIFGMYLPDNVVDDITRKHGAIGTHQEVIYGVALSSDAEQYTRMAEQTAPSELGQLINRYYKLLFKPVRSYGGVITDVIGDAMMAIWPAPKEDAALRQQACLAALSIQRNIQQAHDKSHALPTRIGLHAGKISLGNVGAENRFEYRAVGDIINTTSRIEGLNKLLGTRIIASDEVIRSTTGLLYRELGSFMLVGKTQPVVLHEIICAETDATREKRDLCARFHDGISAYQNNNLEIASDIFNEIIRIFPNDGPGRFYVDLCQQHKTDQTLSKIEKREKPWDGIITIEKK